jgi:hypothetical protein
MSLSGPINSCCQSQTIDASVGKHSIVHLDLERGQRSCCEFDEGKIVGTDRKCALIFTGRSIRKVKRVSPWLRVNQIVKSIDSRGGVERDGSHVASYDEVESEGHLWNQVWEVFRVYHESVGLGSHAARNGCSQGWSIHCNSGCVSRDGDVILDFCYCGSDRTNQT